jgi:hypothetical protein
MWGSPENIRLSILPPMVPMVPSSHGNYYWLPVNGARGKQTDGMCPG